MIKPKRKKSTLFKKVEEKLQCTKLTRKQQLSIKFEWYSTIIIHNKKK